jgi:deoxyribonuclease V
MNESDEFPKSFSVFKAHESQRRLSRKLVTEDRVPRKINYVAGVDVAYSGNRAVGAVAVLDYPSLNLLEYQTATCEAKFPYVPTLLSFREVPPSMACIRKLKLRPDVFLVDGHGMAHPLRCGFASHLGLAINKPTIGVAKSGLIGGPVKIGNEVLIFDKGQIVGSEVVTKKRSKSVYVSIGHMVSLKRAIKIVRHCAANSRIPKPLLLAHRIATEEKEKDGTEKNSR